MKNLSAQLDTILKKHREIEKKLSNQDLLDTDKLIELNKGPDMGAKDDRDRRVKIKVQEDLFDLLGVIKSTGKNGFRKVW